jgi:ribosome-binding protein aMBF1 (putative translation factor)
MGICEVCGNKYDKAFSISVAGGKAHGQMYCCAHCARHAGEPALRDRA